MFAEPLAGGRQILVTERRTAVDWAIALRDLVDSRYADARVIVSDHGQPQHAHTGITLRSIPACRGVAKRLEIYHTPKHGSWLNMAENELSTLSRQCLARRIGTNGTFIYADQDLLQEIVEDNLDGIFVPETGGRMHVKVPEFMVGDILSRGTR